MTRVLDRRVGRQTLDLVVSEHERFASFLARRLGDRATAEDVLQTAYANVLARDAGPADRTRLTAWFFRVLRRALLDHRRAAASEERRVRARARVLPWTEREEAALREDVCACVGRLLPTLPREQADLLRRVEVEGASVRDAAAALGVTANAAAVRLHRARKALAARLRSLCGACSAHGCLRCECRPPGERRS